MYGPSYGQLVFMALFLMVIGFLAGKLVEFSAVWVWTHVHVAW